MDMNGDPDFCRDILETRVKGILRENLKISRDLSFLHVSTYVLSHEVFELLHLRIRKILL